MAQRWRPARLQGAMILVIVRGCCEIQAHCVRWATPCASVQVSWQNATGTTVFRGRPPLAGVHVQVRSFSQVKVWARSSQRCVRRRSQRKYLIDVVLLDIYYTSIMRDRPCPFMTRKPGLCSRPRCLAPCWGIATTRSPTCIPNKLPPGGFGAKWMPLRILSASRRLSCPTTPNPRVTKAERFDVTLNRTYQARHRPSIAGGNAGPLLITQWIDAEAARIFAAKFHSPEVWPAVRSRFLVIRRPAGCHDSRVGRSRARSAGCTDCGGVCLDQITHLSTGDKDVLEESGGPYATRRVWGPRLERCPLVKRHLLRRDTGKPPRLQVPEETSGANMHKTLHRFGTAVT